MKSFLKTLKQDLCRNPLKDKEGKYVIAQFPNVPIMLFVLAKLMQQITSGGVNEIFSRIGFGTLFVWAYLEFSQGVNSFRRALGLLVLIFIVIN